MVLTGNRNYLEQMAVLGMNGEEDMGILDAYHLRYLRISQPAGHMIAFADTTYEDSLRNGIMKYGGMACVAVWLGFFALSYFFSRWAVKPVEESVRMQKQFVADASHELKNAADRDYGQCGAFAGAVCRHIGRGGQVDGACEPGVQGNALPGGKSPASGQERFLCTG